VKQQGKDVTVLAHIQRLVAEEHRLFEQGELAPDKSKRLAQVQVGWTNAGIFCASGAPCAKPAAMRPRRTSGRQKSWRSTSAECSAVTSVLVRTDRPRSKRLRGMPQDGRCLGASAPVPDLRTRRLLRRIQEQACTSTFTPRKHPIITSLEPGEGWSWCYVDEVAMELK